MYTHMRIQIQMVLSNILATELLFEGCLERFAWFCIYLRDVSRGVYICNIRISQISENQLFQDARRSRHPSKNMHGFWNPISCSHICVYA